MTSEHDTAMDQTRLAGRWRRCRGPGLAWLLGAAAAAAGSIAPAGAQVVQQPIRVPLYWTQIQWGSNPQPSKLGIYVALAGSTTPQLFEFDTGGAGFYPTYAANAPWWGSNWQTTGYTFKQDYDGSKIRYKGDVVSTTLSLFAGSGAGQPLLTAPNVIVGQTATINDQPIDPFQTTAPLEQAFWGDFGMAPKQGKAGRDDHQTLPGPAPLLDSLMAQLTYGTGVTPGFRVHASSAAPWVQIGLGPQDLTVLPTSFQLNRTGYSSATDVLYFENYVISGTLAVSDGASGFINTNTGMILDTGAYATIHDDKQIFPAALSSGVRVVDGALVQVSAPSLLPSQLGASVPFLSFPAGNTVNADLVSVDESNDVDDGKGYYLNTGLLPFLSNDVIYVLGSSKPGSSGSAAVLTLVPQPVPAPLGSAGLTVAAALGGRLRRLRRRIRARDAGAVPPLGAPAP